MTIKKIMCDKGVIAVGQNGVQSIDVHENGTATCKMHSGGRAVVRVSAILDAEESAPKDAL